MHCRNCGKKSEGELFCKKCGKKIERADVQTEPQAEEIKVSKKKGKGLWLVGALAVILIAAISYLLSSSDEKTTTEQPAVKAESTNEDGKVAETEKEEEEKEDAKETKSLEETPVPSVPYGELDILDSIHKGSLMGDLHIGVTKEELIERIGYSLVEYEREGEFRMDYTDATYYFSPSNNRVYSVLLLFDSKTMPASKEIEEFMGDESEQMTMDTEIDDTGLYRVTYSTEDSALSFYFEPAGEKRLTKLTYSSVSVYSANLSTEKKNTKNHPGEIEPIISEIRKEYNKINAEFPEMKGEAGGANKVIYRDKQWLIRKAIEKSSDGTTEYYYANSKLMFIFQFKGKTENRYYFDKGQMIRWINPSKVIIDYDEGQTNSDFIEWEAYWLKKDAE